MSTNPENIEAARLAILFLLCQKIKGEPGRLVARRMQVDPLNAERVAAEGCVNY